MMIVLIYHHRIVFNGPGGGGGRDMTREERRGGRCGVWLGARRDERNDQNDTELGTYVRYNGHIHTRLDIY
jgi:hypothetical protein